jgi:triosephosphate isomerase
LFKGTGKVATPKIAQSVHAKCSSIIAGMYDQEAADTIRILYGGSVTPDSIDDLMNMLDIIAGMYDQEAADTIRILYVGSVTPDSIDDLMNMLDIDGALVGGVSLDVKKLGRIINFQSVAVHS